MEENKKFWESIYIFIVGLRAHTLKKEIPEKERSDFNKFMNKKGYSNTERLDGWFEWLKSYDPKRVLKEVKRRENISTESNKGGK